MGNVHMTLPKSSDAGTPGEVSLEPRARVLVVDDDEHNLLAIRTVIEDLAEVEVAASGDEALRHLLKGEFAVILLDVFMTGMDGYETAQIIRGREQTKRIPIVFLSAVNKEKELRGVVAQSLAGMAPAAINPPPPSPDALAESAAYWAACDATWASSMRWRCKASFSLRIRLAALTHSLTCCTRSRGAMTARWNG